MAQWAHAATSQYKARDYQRLIGTRGFSEELLATHFRLYEGYVQHTNKAIGLLRGETLDPYAAGEVRRRLVWEFNGMRLHELFFEGLVAGGREAHKDGAMVGAIAREWGSMEAWWRHFEAVGAMRGIGWAALVHDPVADRLLNTWVNEHDAGALAGTTTLLILDLFEHAYMRDYGTERQAYLGAWRAAVDWQACEGRLARSQGRPTAVAGA